MSRNCLDMLKKDHREHVMRIILTECIELSPNQTELNQEQTSQLVKNVAAACFASGYNLAIDEVKADDQNS